MRENWEEVKIDDAISDAIHACLDDVINALNRHPNPAAQLVAMSTALAKLLHTATGNEMNRADDVKKMLADHSKRTFEYWEGFASGLFDQERVQ